MPARWQRGDVAYRRPLLGVPAAAIRAWLRARGQGWVEDPSNADERYTRNRIRARLLPALQACWPAYRTTFARSAAHAAEAQQILADVAAQDLAHCGVPPRLDALQTLSAPRHVWIMVPAAFVGLERLPLTPNGKVDRRALPAPDAEETAADAYVAPRNPEEDTLATLWGDILGRPKIGIHDNFFDLGGHSLLAMRLVAHVKEKYGQRLEPAYLRIETLGQLAARLDAMQQMAA